MQEYYLEQKRNNTIEVIIYHFSHILSWFLHFVVDFTAKFLKAVIDALKMLIHI